MRAAGYEEPQAWYEDLPEGYTLEIEKAIENESGNSREALLLRRPDGSVASVFPFDYTVPLAEMVSSSAYNDSRLREGPGWQE